MQSLLYPISEYIDILIIHILCAYTSYMYYLVATGTFLLKEGSALCSLHLQFGFKKGMSTTQCTYSMLETVNYYNFNKSNVFVLMLDSRKAFDIVNYCKLFNELLKRGMSPIV